MTTVQFKGLNPSMVKERFERHYCRPLRQRGLCSNNCTLCAPVAAEVSAKIDEVKPASPYGYLVYLLRERRSDILEGQEHSFAIPISDRFGIPMEANPFILLEMEAS